MYCNVMHSEHSTHLVSEVRLWLVWLKEQSFQAMNLKKVNHSIFDFGFVPLIVRNNHENEEEN